MKDKLIHNFTITKYYKVDEGYHYSKDLLKYNGNTYNPLVSSIYIEDTLTSLSIYKSEGKINYSNEELYNDTLFMKMLNLSKTIKLKLKEENIEENNKTYRIDKKEGENIICIDKDTLLLYNIN